MKKRLNPDHLQWRHRPGLYAIQGDRLIIETDPHTMIAGEADTPESAARMALPISDCFEASLRLDYEFTGVQDECGILLRSSEDHWCSCSVTNRGSDYIDLTIVEFESGYADRSVRQIGSGIHHIYFRVYWWNGNIRFQFSFNGDRYSDLRSFHFAKAGEPIAASIYACSPGSNCFDCTFSEMEFSEQHDRE